MEFRHYNSTEASSIRELFTSVFSESEGETEGRMIGDLAKKLLKDTDAEDLFVFVAVEHNEVIGAVCVTRMPAEKEAEIFVLAPVAVASKYQGMGIGQKLIKYGITELKGRGIKLLVTYGDPNFYSKTGFQKIAEKTIQPPFKLTQPEGWLAQSLDGSPLMTIEGKCSCVSALDDSRYW